MIDQQPGQLAPVQDLHCNSPIFQWALRCNHAKAATLHPACFDPPPAAPPLRKTHQSKESLTRHPHRRYPVSRIFCTKIQDPKKISPGVIPNSLGNNASKENLRTHLCCHLCCSYSASINGSSKENQRTMNKLHVWICEVATLPLLKGMLIKRVFSKRFATTAEK